MELVCALAFAVFCAGALSAMAFVLSMPSPPRQGHMTRASKAWCALTTLALLMGSAGMTMSIFWLVSRGGW